MKVKFLEVDPWKETLKIRTNERESTRAQIQIKSKRNNLSFKECTTSLIKIVSHFNKQTWEIIVHKSNYLLEHINQVKSYRCFKKIALSVSYLLEYLVLKKEKKLLEIGSLKGGLKLKTRFFYSKLSILGQKTGLKRLNLFQIGLASRFESAGTTIWIPWWARSNLATLRSWCSFYFKNTTKLIGLCMDSTYRRAQTCFWRTSRAISRHKKR